METPSTTGRRPARLSLRSSPSRPGIAGGDAAQGRVVLEDTRAGKICSPDLLPVRPTTSIEDAIRIMRDAAVRRLSVIESGRLVGVLSLGDLAAETDAGSALGRIGQVFPNH